MIHIWVDHSRTSPFGTVPGSLYRYTWRCSCLIDLRYQRNDGAWDAMQEMRMLCRKGLGGFAVQNDRGLAL